MQLSLESYIFNNDDNASVSVAKIKLPLIVVKVSEGILHSNKLKNNFIIHLFINFFGPG